MIELTEDFIDDYDLHGKVQGFIGTRRLTIYEKEDQMMPTDSVKGINPKKPCILVEEIDEELSIDTVKDYGTLIMRPVDYIEISQELVDFFKKYLESKPQVFEDEN